MRLLRASKLILRSFLSVAWDSLTLFVSASGEEPAFGLWILDSRIDWRFLYDFFAEEF